MIKEVSIKKLVAGCFRGSRLLEVSSAALIFGVLVSAGITPNGISGTTVVLLVVVILVAYSIISLQQLLLIGLNPNFWLEMDSDTVIIIFPAHSIKYKRKHLVDYGDRLILRFPYNFTRFYSLIPIE